MEKIKIFFILPTLFAGGAERVISFVAQNLDKSKFEVTLIVIGFKKDSKFEVKGISSIYLNKKRVLASFFSIIKLLIKQKPQVVVSSISHLNAMMGLISMFFPKISFIGRHSTITNVAKKYKTRKRKQRIYSFFNLGSFGLRKLDYLICQSLDMKSDFLSNHEFDENKVKIIHNPITYSGSIKEAHQKNEIKKFITIGRLSKTKGQLRLIDVLGKLKFPFHFTVIGTGGIKEAFFEKINELGLSKHITHIEHTDNVYKYLIDHDMFLQGSYSEGFPNALLESCVAGTPVIAFDVPGGTSEIVENGINGFLVNNENEFLEKLHDSREWNPRNIHESVMKKFNKEKILKQYENLFIETIS